MFKKQYFTVTLLVFLMAALSACYDTPNFVEDNSEEGRGYAPVLSDITGYESQYSQGDEFTFVLQYFSQETIESITIHELVAEPGNSGTETVIQTFGPDAGSFSNRLHTDTLAVSYTVPQVADNTVITLKGKVTNVNTLADSVSFSITVIDD